MSLELLWKNPGQEPHPPGAWMPYAYDDLQMERLFGCFPCRNITRDPEEFRRFFFGLWTADGADIAFRNEAVGLFRDNPALWEALSGAIAHVRQAVSLWEDRSLKAYGALMQRFSCARHYIRAFVSLRDALAGGTWPCECILRLRDWAQARWREEELEELGEGLDALREAMPPIPALRIGINVDDTLQPVQIISGPCLDRSQGLFEGPPGGADSLSRPVPFSRGGFGSALQEHVYRELTLHQRPQIKKLEATLGRMSFAAMDDLHRLSRQFVFYDVAMKMTARMAGQGFHMAAADIAPKGEPIAVRGLIPLLLALDGRTAVANDMDLRGFDIVTGANQSGKTMLVTSVGQLQWLFQTGFPLPCHRARLGPADGIHTLFATGEAAGKYDSRMGYETGRLQAITDDLTAHALVLLNEPMTGTSAVEAVEICAALLRRLGRDGIRGMMATHYVTLYHTALHEGADPDYLGSLVMEATGGDGADCVPTYRVRSMAPRSMDARAMAREYNLSLSQLLSAVPGGEDLLPEVTRVIKNAREEAQQYGTAAP